MKIMVLASYAPSLLYFRKDMMVAMIANGHEVIAAAPESQADWANKFAAYKIKYISISGLERNNINPIKDIIAFYFILRMIINEKPDKVFVNQAKAVVYGCIAAKLAGVSQIYALVSGLGSILRSERKYNIAKYILIAQYSVALRLCEKIFFHNKDDCEEMKSLGIIGTPKVVIINGSGVNLSHFRPKPIPDRPIFLFIGRIIKDKGVLELIEAAKIVKRKYPTTIVQLLGNFDTNPTAITKKELQKYIDDGVIEYLGSTNDVRPFIENCSVSVLPSYHEGTPRSILEAMAIGRPIITTDAPGCRETVVDGVNGYLVPVKNVEVLAQKMIWMIEHPYEAAQMGNESIHICKEKFDVNLVNNKILVAMDLC